MLTFKCKVLFVQDETRDVPIKDKNGVPTQLTKRYRFVTIQGMARDNELKTDRPIVVKSMDPTFPIPATGADFTTPEVKKYEVDNGVPVINV